MPIFVQYNTINGNFMADNAVLFNGVNQMFGWSSHVKQINDLFISGVWNPQVGNYNFDMDFDFADMNINDADVNVGSEFTSL